MKLLAGPSARTTLSSLRSPLSITTMRKGISRLAAGDGIGWAIPTAATARISPADGSSIALPYCEEGLLHDLPSDGMPDDLSRVQRVGAAQVIQSPLSIVNCPSRRPTTIYPLTANEGGSIGFFNSITPQSPAAATTQ